ncbi:MinD/ParA family protein [Halobacillus yeomjeoni]|uniref:MinD/ParA family protein n=1 Tax=Halobacillus yeomjeoni TaxID=311194 RepID=A0A931MUA1_9BACI|nr:MinD/ParA family protein [Halobacillus yeomjeoni]MBH0229291.1 MinD/ParA family protein [Halobacillus yeomjeoni]MCA0983310.1 MinD/ParA family protein [Halobacillus yeomjeoni]
MQMNDQAERLRNRIKQLHSQREVKIMAIASGKGGVGKSNFTINFALKLKEQGKRVLIFDLDIGMGNIDILMGVSPKHSFIHMFEEELTLKEIIETGPNGLSYIAGGTGLSDIFQLDLEKFNLFQTQFEEMAVDYDYILFDMGAGISVDTLHFITSAHEAVIVTTPEPTSITDAYSLIKHLSYRDKEIPISVLVNRPIDEHSGKQAFDRLQKVVGSFLEIQIGLLGIIPDDKAVVQSVHKQVPFVLEHPNSKASRALQTITSTYISDKGEAPESFTHESFFAKLRRLVFPR